MEYTGFDSYMKQRFGGKIYRLSLSTGCTCPNRDGRCGTGGCIFCSAGGSGEFAAGIEDRPQDTSCGDAAYRAGSARDDGLYADSAEYGELIIDSVNRQIESAKARVASKLSRSFAGYMAYFQSFTNTYFRNDREFADVKARFFAAAGHPEIAAVAIATRPDSLPQYVLDMLAELNQIRPVIVELGLQTMHDSTARIINRCYETAVYDRAVAGLHAAGIGVVTHMIAGLPGETEDMMADTVRHIVSVSRSGTGQDAAAGTDTASMPDGIKIQLLHVLKGTELARMAGSGEISIREYSLEEYCALLRHLLPLIPKEMVVHRLTGDPPKNLLISPLWTADKKHVLNSLKKALEC